MVLVNYEEMIQTEVSEGEKRVRREPRRAPNTELWSCSPGGVMGSMASPQPWWMSTLLEIAKQGSPPEPLVPGVCVCVHVHTLPAC